MQINSINSTQNHKSQTFQADFHATTNAKALLKNSTFDTYEKVVEKATEGIDGTIMLIKSGANKIKMLFSTPEGAMLKRTVHTDISPIEFEKNATDPNKIKTQVLAYMSNMFEENGKKVYDNNPFLEKFVQHFNSTNKTS